MGMTNETNNAISFKSLGLKQELIQAVDDMGFTACTPIQAASLPIALTGKDVAGMAQTGTGKTAAFLLAMFDQLLTSNEKADRQSPHPRGFIMAPTRELVLQIHKDAIALSKHTDLKINLAYGGTGYDTQRETIENGTDVLIGTPGRIIDYFKQKVFNLRDVEVMVLDEADRMFDLGFIKDIRFLMRRLPDPEKRQSMLYSATLSHRVMELAYDHMNKPETVKIESKQITADQVSQTMYHPANDEKIPLLLGLMQEHSPTRTIIFVNTKRAAEKIWGFLEGNGHHAAILSGNIRQSKRESLLKQFHQGELPILVATDVASRGLHIPEISHVINYDLPDMAEDYVHRIGRTARAGSSGDAISFACEDYAINLPEIEAYIGQKIKNKSVHDIELITPKPPKHLEVKRPHNFDNKHGNNKGGNSRNKSRQYHDKGKHKPAA